MHGRAVWIAGLVVVTMGLVVAGFALPRNPATAVFVEPPGQATQSLGSEESEDARVLPAPGPTLAAPADPSVVRAPGAWLFGWALMDRETGTIKGSRNAATMTNTVESMIKPWIAADYLRRLAAAGKTPTTQQQSEIALMIIDSNDPMAEKYFYLGGGDAVTRRMVSVCGLSKVTIEPTLWSFTLMTPHDAAKFGQCLADGRAAGPQWTPWLLDTMKRVRGTVRQQISGSVQGGRWGIIDGLPPELSKDASIKNGFTSYKDGWHINCLAIHPLWTLSVMMRTYRGLQAGALACESVAAALVRN